jgi:hypothetical protein
MSSLHDRLEELLADVPSVVHADVAGAATGGRRRRVRRRVASVGVGALVVLVAALAVLVLPGSRVDRDLPADTRPVVDGYPTHLRADRHPAPLPAVPGPMAGVLLDSPDDAWRIASATGRTWRLRADGGVQPVLSPDGTRLAYAPRGGALVVRDLVSGGRTPVGIRPSDSRSHGWELDLDSTIRWSPDGRALAMLATKDGVRGQHLVVWPGNGLVDLGRADVVPGWSSRTTLVKLLKAPDGRGYGIWEYRLGSRGRFAATAGFDSYDNYPAVTVALAEAPLSNHVFIDRDRARLLVYDRGDSTGGVVDTYDLGTGSRRETQRGVLPAYAVNCQWSMAGDQPAYLNDAPRGGTDAFDRPRLVTPDGRTLVTLEPNGPSWCASFATAALAGTPHTDLLARVLGTVGLDDSWAYWRWRELSLGVLVVGLLPLLVAAARRSARSRATLVLDAAVSLAVTVGVTAGVVRDRFVLQSSGGDLVVHLLPAGVLLALLWVLPVRERSAPRLAAVAVALLAAVDPAGEVWPWLALLGIVTGLGPVAWRWLRRRPGRQELSA